MCSVATEESKAPGRAFHQLCVYPFFVVGWIRIKSNHCVLIVDSLSPKYGLNPRNEIPGTMLSDWISIHIHDADVAIGHGSERTKHVQTWVKDRRCTRDTEEGGPHVRIDYALVPSLHNTVIFYRCTCPRKYMSTKYASRKFQNVHGLGLLFVCLL